MADRELVTGEIVLPAGTSFDGATVTVRLENVSMMDAPAQVVAEQVRRGVKYDSGTIPFTLRGTLGDDARARYSVSAHISLSGNGDMHKGDFISTQSYPVLTHGNPNRVRVEVRKI